MKSLLFLSAILLLMGCSTTAEVLEFEANQSMAITGKGPGQDAVENPFADEASVAVVNNRGRSSILARVKTRDGRLGTTPIPPKKKRSLVILPGTELYLDSPAAGKVKITFKRFEVE
ncbi:hypothetical protein [Lewinella sp. W8]|uniref:hypothetical protein n=1 Tax=Lewinella sp. W8 TaxID=2528208 RepID=UPI0010673782|nr:hypothetical protein [Lewinella sp. W8]MTB51130.1 hypothetical protein [Lewinella sp. W8]